MSVVCTFSLLTFEHFLYAREEQEPVRGQKMVQEMEPVTVCHEAFEVSIVSNPLALWSFLRGAENRYYFKTSLISIPDLCNS